ncbi:hypothetical protein BaRGS_00021776 [Batillaria attramentaria]|uniref:Beta-lactamase-related domain-containing protein n=1 Tax=Batillaria attramentaria TaxID=370345 RepID=A0ABD0KIF6_9CAEN
MHILHTADPGTLWTTRDANTKELKVDLFSASITPMEPAGGIASSADDMAKWLKLHMRNGQTPDGAAIINEKHMRDMHTAHMLLPPEFAGGRQNFFQPQFPESAALVGYGYGWFTSVYRGRQVVSHGGSLFAYRSNLAFLPDDDVGVFVSSTGPARYLSSQQLFYYITDLLLDLDPWLNTSTVCTFPAPWNSDDQRSSPSGPSPVPGALENSDLFVGQYGNLLFGDVEILHNGTGQLSLKFQRLVANLYKTDNDSLLLAEAIGPLSFLSHVGNTTEYMRITFSDSSPRADGKYQELQMHDVARVPLTFRRDVKFSDPVPDKVKNAGGETPLWKLLSQDV